MSARTLLNRKIEYPFEGIARILEWEGGTVNVLLSGERKKKYNTDIVNFKPMMGKF